MLLTNSGAGGALDNRSMRVKAPPTDRSIPFVWIPWSWTARGSFTRATVPVVRLDPFLSPTSSNMGNIDCLPLFISFSVHSKLFCFL